MADYSKEIERGVQEAERLAIQKKELVEDQHDTSSAELYNVLRVQRVFLRNVESFLSHEGQIDATLASMATNVLPLIRRWQILVQTQVVAFESKDTTTFSNAYRIEVQLSNTIESYLLRTVEKEDPTHAGVQRWQRLHIGNVAAAALLLFLAIGIVEPAQAQRAKQVEAVNTSEIRRNEYFVDDVAFEAMVRAQDPQMNAQAQLGFRMKANPLSSTLGS